MIPLSLLSSFVADYATYVGFTGADVTSSPRSDVIIRLDDDVVDEHVSFEVKARDLLRVDRESVLRGLAYQIDQARRGVERRVMGGEACP